MVGKGLRLIQQWDRWDNPLQPLIWGLPFSTTSSNLFPNYTLISQQTVSRGSLTAADPRIPVRTSQQEWKSQYQLKWLIYTYLVHRHLFWVKYFPDPSNHQELFKFSLCFVYSSYFALPTCILIYKSLYLAIQHSRKHKDKCMQIRRNLKNNQTK